MLTQQIEKLNNFAIMKKEDVQNRMKEVKDDLGAINQYSSTVDRAKNDYIVVRKKQVEMEIYQSNNDQESQKYFQQLETERLLYYDVLKE